MIPAWFRNATLLASLTALAGLALVDGNAAAEVAARAFEAGDADLALRLGSRALLFGSLDAEHHAMARRAMAGGAAKLGRRAFAYAELAQALQSDPKEQRSLIMRGEMRLADHDYATALDDLTRALRQAELSPDYPGIIAKRCAKRGLAWLGLRKLEEAMEDATRAHELRRTLPDAHYLRAMILEAQENHSEALAAMEIAYALKLEEGGAFSLDAFTGEGGDWLAKLIELRMRNGVDPRRPFLDVRAKARAE